MNIAKQILTTRGVNSRVLVKGTVQALTKLGHVGLFDFDGISKQEVLHRTMHLDGINILWASSSTGYHVWNLSIRSADEIALLGLKLKSDCKHIGHGYSQDKWVLRIMPKYKSDAQYKPAPKLVHTWCNDSLRIQSKPHFTLFIALTGKTTLHKLAYNFDGLAAEIEDYMTMTDTMKGEIHGTK